MQNLAVMLICVQIIRNIMEATPNGWRNVFWLLQIDISIKVFRFIKKITNIKQINAKNKVCLIIQLKQNSFNKMYDQQSNAYTQKIRWAFISSSFVNRCLYICALPCKLFSLFDYYRNIRMHALRNWDMVFHFVCMFSFFLSFIHSFFVCSCNYVCKCISNN